MTYEHEGFYVGAYVPGRGDSLEIGIQRTLHMFRLLKEIDPTFARWFEKGYTPEEAHKRRLDIDRSELAKAFEPTKTDGNAWYFLSAWNGLGEDEASGFRLSCGSHSPQDVDDIIFRPHEIGPIGERLIQAPVLSKLLRALVVAWDPQMGIVISHRHREAAFADAEFENRIGWINYFSHKLGAIPPLPLPVRTELVEDKGSLVILTPERFSTSNSEHIALSRRVSAELKNAGVLRPLRRG